MRKLILTVLILMFLSPDVVQGLEEHWAQQEIDGIRVAYGVEFYGSHDAHAELALQEKLWKLAGVDLTPVRELQRYSVIKVLAEALQLEEAREAEIPVVLVGFEDICNY